MRSLAFVGGQHDRHGRDQFGERDEAENSSCPGEAKLGLESGEDDGIDYPACTCLVTMLIEYGEKDMDEPIAVPEVATKTAKARRR
jgi:hypothetical protein